MVQNGFVQQVTISDIKAGKAQAALIIGIVMLILWALAMLSYVVRG